MVISTFEQVMREHMNYYDRDTVKAIAEASSSNQNQILVALTSKLYEMIVAKVTKIDYSSVSSSRGDITKIQNYPQLVETVSIIRNIVTEYKCDPKPVDAITTAIDNLQSRTATFKKAFVINAPVVITLFNNIAINIVASVSYMIDTCIEYIKNPQSQSFQMAMDVVAYNNTRDNLMFETLKTFNEGCASGDMDEAIKVSMQQSRMKRESAENIAVQEGYKFNNPDNFTLRLVHSCVKAIRSGRDKGISKEGIERQVANIIDKRLNSVDMNAVMLYGLTYGGVTSNLAHTEAMLRGLRNISLNSIRTMESDYNATHRRKRHYADTYTSQEIDMIKKCANQVRKQKVTVNKEAFESDLEAMADYQTFMMESIEDANTEIGPNSPFMSDDDINGGERIVLHDGDEDESLKEDFDFDGGGGVIGFAGRGLLALCKLVIPLIRHIVYLYYFTRQRISDYYESQAIAIEMNAYQLQFNQEMEPDRREEIYRKQMKVAEKLRRKSQRTSIDYKRTKKDAEKAMDQEQKQFTAADLEYNPNVEDHSDAAAASILF